MKSSHKLFCNLLAGLLLSGCGFCEIVQIEDGAVEGTTMTSRLGRDFHAFLRIPFAQPPIGNLRFSPPQPATPWNGVLNGTAYGPMCMQSMSRPDLDMSEDCLQINVFSTNLVASLPVIVFIFGGGFLFGTGIDQGGPHSLMDREVVLVNFNYRLGALGFLAMETADIPGNAALKDQALALRWVQRNIAHFGGDPSRVTLVGLSAGSASLTGHLISPMTQGLFVGAIGMSAAISRNWIQESPLEVGRKFAENLQCEADDVPAIVACLRSVIFLLCLLFSYQLKV